jgi:hypothetical protein
VEPLKVSLIVINGGKRSLKIHFKKKGVKVMNFKRVERNDYIEANKSKGDFADLLNSKCSICKKNEWTSEVKSTDGASFECLTGFGCRDGSAFVCNDCFKSYFEEHSWDFGKLFV